MLDDKFDAAISVMRSRLRERVLKTSPSICFAKSAKIEFLAIE